MDERIHERDGFQFEGEPHNPISGQSGDVGELLAELSDAQVAEYCRYWTWRSDSYKASGQGFNGWKSSVQLSTGYVEARSRTLDVDALRSAIEGALR